MPKNKEPKEKTKQTPEDFFSKIEKKVKEAETNVSDWANKQLKWHKLRMRIKKTKTFPFPNCSNIRMPTAEIKIRKLKASLINTIFGIRPVVQVIPPPSGNWQTAKKIEKFLDHLIMDVVKVKPKAVIAVDQELEKGFSILQPYWKCETTTRLEKVNLKDFSLQEVYSFFDPDLSEDDRVEMLMGALEVDTSDRVFTYNDNQIRNAVAKILSGESEFDISLQDVLYDFPDVAIIPAERCLVPSDAGHDVQDLEFVCIEKYLPLRALKQNAQDEGKGWDMEAVNDITVAKDLDIKNLTETQKDLREGIQRLNNPSEQVKIWELQGWYDLNGDGVPEKVHCTLAPEFKKTLRKISLPWSSGKYNVVKFFYELIDDRWFSHRGIVEIAEDIIKEIDIQHMQKIDHQTIANSGMFVYRAGMVNPNMVNFQLNQAIPVHGMQALDDTIKPINLHNPNIEFSYEREEQILSGRLEELIGQVDFNLQSMINRREPRTLGEVNLQHQAQQLVFSLDADLHSMQFTELFNWIWDLWCQFGSDEYEFAYFGQGEYEPIKLSREEIQGKYKITVRGNDQNTNSQVRLQKAQMILQSHQNPVYLQTGILTPVHLANGLKRFYQDLDIPNPEELANFNPPPMQTPPPVPPAIEPKFADLAEGEQMQVVQMYGLKPDIPGRLLEKKQELLESQPTRGAESGNNRPSKGNTKTAASK